MARTARHDGYMELALEQAEAAARLGEVPVGAVVVYEGNVVARAHNRRELAQDPLAHAEILAIGRAAKALGTWRLTGASLYVTLEPCPMCAGALVNARLDHLIYGCADPKAGAVRTLYALCEDPRLNHRVEVVRGVLSERCSAVLRDFFARLRAGKSKERGAEEGRSLLQSQSFSTVSEREGQSGRRVTPARFPAAPSRSGPGEADTGAITVGWNPDQRGVDPARPRDYSPPVDAEDASRRPDKKK